MGDLSDIIHKPSDVSAEGKNIEVDTRIPKDIEENLEKRDIDLDEIDNSGEVPELPGTEADERIKLDDIERSDEYAELPGTDVRADLEDSSNSGSDEAEENPEETGQEDVDKSYPCVEEEDGRKCYYDDNGELYRIDADLLPNHTYEINGYQYETDDEGRIISAGGNLKLKDREGRLPIRDSLEDIGKGDEKEDDDRGHLIGDQFNGSNGLENMIPQDAEINRNDYKNFENELAKAVKEGKEVYVKVEPVYEGDSHRPTALVVTYSIDGEENVRIFPNNTESSGTK